jgi:hypothetical protein
MAVVSTPVSGRLNLTYLNHFPALSINNINPGITEEQALTFIGALDTLQEASVRDVFVSVESDLTVGP